MSSKKVHYLYFFSETIDMDEHEDFVQRFEMSLKANSLNQKELAEKLGMRRPSISDWKKKGTYPYADIAVKIAKNLNTTVEYLITGEDNSGYPPEIMEIARKIASLSPEDRQDILDFIDIKLKKVKREEKIMQAVAVREPEPVYLVKPPTPVRSEIIDSVVFLDWGVAEIPLLGTTAAGHPIDFGDIPPDPPTRKWSASLIKGDLADYYCVVIRGQSMTEADIKDGDHALLRHTQKPKQGEIMLVRHDNSSTLKRIRIVKSKNGQEEVYICWEDGSKRRVMLNGDGDEIQGLLIAIERTPGKR